MKTLRFIGMALLAVVLSVNFAACSEEKDDDDDFVALLTSAAWRESRDSDSGDKVATFSKDGTGFQYTHYEDYRNELKIGYSFKWAYANGVMTVELQYKHYSDGSTSDYEKGDTQIWTVLTSNKSQIVFDVLYPGITDEDDPDYGVVTTRTKTLTRIN